MSDIICGENYNTLKKGPNWNEIASSKNTLAIEPPPEFQDKPKLSWLNNYANHLMLIVLKDAMDTYCKIVNRKLNTKITPRFWTSEWLTFSPCHNNARPSSRNSLGSSRLSCSHNSLSVPSTCRVDDSNFITQAVSHDTLTTNQISDLYNVPFDSDVYAVPIDVVKPPLKPKRNQQKRRRTTCVTNTVKHKTGMTLPVESVSKKRHSVAGSSIKHIDEPIHMTLQEVRQYLQTLYSSSSDSSEHKIKERRPKSTQSTRISYKESVTIKDGKIICTNEETKKVKKNNINNKNNKKEVKKRHISNSEQDRNRRCPVRNFSTSLKQTICNLFRFRRFVSSNPKYTKDEDSMYGSNSQLNDERKGPITSRALPPLPSENKAAGQPKTSMDFASSIEKVKDVSIYILNVNTNNCNLIIFYNIDFIIIILSALEIIH